MAEAAAAHVNKKARTETMTSWVEIPAECDWTVHNIPFAVFRPAAEAAPRCCTAIGNFVVDLSAVANAGLLPEEYKAIFSQPALNDFMGMGRPKWREVRMALQALFTGDDARLKDSAELQAGIFTPLDKAIMCMPCRVGDYTDFYSSREHATNVGTMFRGADNALQPNWLHLPVGYHGRSSTIVVDGTPIRRPRGQLQKDATNPKEGSVFGPCRLFDFELEVAAFVGVGNEMGTSIKIEEAEDHIFGLAVMNDWSARDIQKWEYVPLGPFTAKNVATTISPWIVTLDALEPFKCPTSAGAQTDPEPLPYLRDPDYRSYDINLSVSIKPEGAAEESVITRSNFRYLYWNIKQQLVHHTVTGCAMQPGDCLGSGTISGPTPDMYGSMLELSWKGSKEVALKDGGVRKFLKDGDDVVMRGFCEKDGVRVGFGTAAGKVLPAHTD